MRIGIHTSIAGSLENAALKAVELGANTFQIFSSSPRMWRASAHGPLNIALFKQARKRHGLSPLVVHSNYLINLASSDEPLRKMSVTSYRGEIGRALALGADYLVVHPGNHKGYTLSEGMEAVVRSIVESVEGLDTGPLTLLLENTVGGTNQLGGRFAELAVLRDFVSRQARVKIGFCIDTCHCLAAGYDVASAAGLRETVREMENVLGGKHVPVIHSNDSKGALGSRIDRHANIGEGYIGTEGFRRILTHPKLRSKAFILETPVDNEGDDKRNVEMLKRLCLKSTTTITKSS